MGVVFDKLFGPGAAPLVEAETQGACSSQCCEDLEVVSSSSSEPLTHASAHAATDSWATEEEIEKHVPRASGTSVAARVVSRESGQTRATRL
jgi:hypothetical protein